jgi:rhodanese-related sulfurtransferase
MLQRFLKGTTSHIPSVNPREAWNQLSNADTSSAPPVLIDVQEPWKFIGGHARGANNMPLSQLPQHVREVPRDREVLLICQSGHRSMQAVKFLQQQGVPRVVNVTGGTTVWHMHGLPMEQDNR